MVFWTHTVIETERVTTGRAVVAAILKQDYVCEALIHINNRDGSDVSCNETGRHETLTTVMLIFAV